MILLMMMMVAVVMMMTIFIKAHPKTKLTKFKKANKIFSTFDLEGSEMLI